MFQMKTRLERFSAASANCHASWLEHVVYDCDGLYKNIRLEIGAQATTSQFNIWVIISRHTCENLT